MATAKDQQVAQCVAIKSYTKKDKAGNPVIDEETGEVVNNEIYHMELEGKKFELFQSSYFKAVKGKYYTPSIDVYAKAYNDKEGKARNRNTVVVNWQEVK
jgi:hypothetical protein